MTDINSQTLHVVAKELAATLNEARAALEIYAERPEQVEQLQKCGEHLHQAHGVLRLVEVYGAALLAEEMEQVTRHLLDLDGDKKPQMDGLDALMRAMVQLPTYLERVLSGGRDLALILLPLLNDLRAVRGSPLLSEGTLLLLNLKSDQPAQPQPMRPGEPPLSITQWARRLRARFQSGLLGLIRGERVEQNLEIMVKAAEKLEQVATTQPVFQLWWVTGAVLEALRSNGLESSATLKRLLGQADRQIKRLYEIGEARYCESPPIDLLNNMLYYVARASSSGGRISAVRASFRLGELLPVDQDVEQERESLSAPSVKLMHTVADAIKEDLSKVKDVLDIFVRRGGGQIEELVSQLELLKKISDTLGVLGLGELRQRVQGETAELSQSINQGKTPGEDALLKMAATLLAVEDSLDDQLVSLILPGTAPEGTAQPADDNDFSTVTEAVLRECIVNMARVKEAISIAVSRPEDSLQQGLDNVPQLLRGITAGLLMLGKSRAVEVMDAIGSHIRKLVEPSAPAPDQARLERIADAIVSIEYYMETLQSGRSDPWYMLDNAETCIKALEDSAQRVPLIVEPQADVLKTMKIDAAPPVAVEVYAATQPVALAPVPLAAEQIDPQILELFIEEAKEEIASIGKIFPMWDQNPMDTDSLGTLRRSFHTLKGSGRMVGARLIGEFGWAIENLFNRLIDKTLTRTPGIMGTLRNAVAALPALVEQLESGRPIAMSVEPIMLRAYAYAEGRDPETAVPQRAEAPRAPAAAEPVPSAERSEPARPEQPAPVPAPVAEQAEPTVAHGASRPVMDPVLHEIYSKESVGHLVVIRDYLRKRLGQPPPHDLPESVYRAIHTLSGSSKMAEARHGIRITAPLNDYMRKVFDSNRGLTEAGLAALNDSVTAIDDVLAHINESSAYFAEQPSLVERLQALELELDADLAREAAAANARASAPATLDFEDIFASVPPEAAIETAASPIESPAPFETYAQFEAYAPFESPAPIEGPVVFESVHGEGVAYAETAGAFEGTEPSELPAPIDSIAPVEAAAAVADASTFEHPTPAEEFAQTEARAAFDDPLEFERPSSFEDSAALQGSEPVNIGGLQGAGEQPAPAHEPAIEAFESPPEAFEPFEDAVLAAEIHDSSSEARAAPEEMSAPAEFEVANASAPAGEEAAAGEETAADEEFDSEIAAIYSEEATELLEAAEASLSGWKFDRNDRSKVAELQRQLHTLKGGARMAGVTAMGDLSHELESLLVDIDSGLVAGDDRALDVMQSSIDELARMRDFLSAGQRVPRASALIDRIRALSNAAPSVAPAQTSPVPAQRTPAPTQTSVAEMPPASEPARLDERAEPIVSATTAPDAAMAAADTALAPAAIGATPETSAADAAPSMDAALAADSTAAQAIAAAGDEVPVHAELEPAVHEVPETRSTTEDSVRSLLESPEPPTAQATDAEATAESSPAPILPGRDVVQPERSEMARVDADLLDTMLNNAGEVSIFRARLDQQVSSIDFNLAELARTVIRLKDQLRGLEIETEAQVLNRHDDIQPRRDDFDPLELDRYSALQQYSRALAETSSDVASIQGLLEALTREAQNLLTQQSRVITELQNGLMRTRMVPFQRHVQRLTRLVRQAANDTHKRAELAVEGAAAELDRQVLERMVPPLEHLLRNAVVHGIETPERRTAAGKPEVGRISIGIERDGAEVVIIVADDGGGINVKLIREKAISLGLADPGRKLTDEEAMQLILEPGFSTAGRITQAAGRGVGMDVVATEVKKLGGGLFIESTAGRGSRFTIRLPFTLAISQALIVRVADEVYALPLATVEGVVRLPKTIVARHLGKDAPVFEYGAQKYRFQQLGTFVGLGASPLPEADVSVSVVLIRAGEHSTALVTDELVGSREIVVKSLGPQISSVRGIAGATILGDGRIVVILDMGALVRSEWRAKVAEPLVSDHRDRRTFALVVDDSITVRRVTQRLLERNGMRVITAKDGVDAISVLQEHLPDVILLDIEMPRMDGYEVATHVRNDPRLKDVPIVMITSRVSEKHRARAIEIGVDDYLGKPYQENQLLDAIEPLVHRSRLLAQERG